MGRIVIILPIPLAGIPTRIHPPLLVSPIVLTWNSNLLRTVPPAVLTVGPLTSNVLSPTIMVILRRPPSIKADLESITLKTLLVKLTLGVTLIELATIRTLVLILPLPTNPSSTPGQDAVTPPFLNYLKFAQPIVPGTVKDKWYPSKFKWCIIAVLLLCLINLPLFITFKLVILLVIDRGTLLLWRHNTLMGKPDVRINKACPDESIPTLVLVKRVTALLQRCFPDRIVTSSTLRPPDRPTSTEKGPLDLGKFLPPQPYHYM